MGQNAMAINIHCTHTLPKNKHIHLSNLVKIFLHFYRFGLRFSSVCCCCNCCFFSFVFFSLLAFWTFISWSDEQKLAHTLNIYTHTPYESSWFHSQVLFQFIYRSIYSIWKNIVWCGPYTVRANKCDKSPKNTHTFHTYQRKWSDHTGSQQEKEMQKTASSTTKFKTKGINMANGISRIFSFCCCCCWWCLWSGLRFVGWPAAAHDMCPTWNTDI